MDIQKDKDFTSLPEIAKLYQACKERDLTIVEREYLKGARDAWQAAKTQAVPEGFVLVPKEPTLKMSIAYQKNAIAPVSSLSISGYKAMIARITLLSMQTFLLTKSKN